MLVIISHWVPNNKINTIPNGVIGVTFFFVLSGYLISSNLLYLKRSVSSGEISTGKAFGIFYIRRMLRIFPLYYMVILLVYFFSPCIFEGSHLIWYLTYMPNIAIFREQAWPGMLSHFWSLGVEEQFYLLWPLLIFIFSWNWLKYLFTGTIIVSVCFKCFFNMLPYYTVLPISCFDSFGLGAVLAYQRISFDSSEKRLTGLIFSQTSLACVTVVLLILVNGFNFLSSLLISIISFIIIRKASGSGFGGFIGWILNNRIIQYLGKISYGLYVYHNFIPWLWRCITGKEYRFILPIPSVHIPWLNKPIVALTAEFFLLIGIASLSWFIVEKPLNDLKKWAI